MVKRLLMLCLFLFTIGIPTGVLLFYGEVPVTAQFRSVYWQRWDVVIDEVQLTENQFRVREQYRIVFDGRFSFGTREIPLERVGTITDVQVYQSGERLIRSCDNRAGTACIQESDGSVNILYYFLAPVQDDTVSITIEYTVEDGLRSYPDGDQLWWIALPADRPARVENSVIVVNLPDAAVPRGGADPVVTYGTSAEVDICTESRICNGIMLPDYVDSVAAAVVVARATTPIYIGNDFEIRVQYPHNSLMPVPAWQQFDDFQRTVEGILPFALLLLAGFIAIGGPLAIVARYYTHGRDPHVGPVPDYLSEPPSDLPPALVGALVDERVDLRDIFSTVLDLANRGYIVIEEERTEGLIFGIGSSSEITFKRTNLGEEGLLSYEKKIMKHIFRSSDERKLSDLKNRFYQYIGTLQKELYNILTSRKFFETSPASIRTNWQFGGVGLLVLAFVLFLIFSVQDDTVVFSSWMPVYGAIGFSGIVMILFSGFMPAKTYNGAVEAAKWKAFREYLQHLDRYTDVEHAADQFDRYLPYAVALGLDDTWINHFTRPDIFVPVPRWYYPTYIDGPFGRHFDTGSSVPSRTEWREAWGGQADGSFSPDDIAGDFSLDTLAGNISEGLNTVSAGITNMLNQTSAAMQSRPSSSGSSGSWSGGGSSFSGGGFSGGGGGGGSAGFG